MYDLKMHMQQVLLCGDREGETAESDLNHSEKVYLLIIYNYCGKISFIIYFCDW